ncbi:MAG TPA: 3-phosphoshikimate 1-carboxyvinyltransferase [Vicinamibacterales bacterium]|jgi:3-phosphoshikimate 1-carboxyvinyltransferase|nr:3-phosphoshikimate 1-carboxyvinyltransferase [Vicinamibacterales bacterium]
MVSIADVAEVPRVSNVTGTLRVPGDKSVSHRYAMLASVAIGTTRLQGYLPGADCLATLDCLEALGVSVIRIPGVHGLTLEIEGRGPRGLRTPGRPLDAANSGTSMRLLAGLVAGHPFITTLTGDESLSRRPMRRIIEPLTTMGASVDSDGGRPPLTIAGGDLHAIAHTPPVPSAQVKSAVLLAGLHAAGVTSVHERVPTRDHTERAVEAFGGRIVRDGDAVSLAGGQRLSAIHATVPGDISSAAFWLALAAGTPGASLAIEGVGLNPSRSHLLAVLRRAGADIETREDHAGAGEPSGTIHVRFGSPRSFEIGPDEVPLVIDEIPALAALAVMTGGTSLTVSGAAELRVKETDRISMLASGFRALGADVDEYADGFHISGGPLQGGTADAAGDHRLAMAFAIAAARARGPARIVGAQSVAVSYPGFFDVLQQLSRSGGAR